VPYQTLNLMIVGGDRKGKTLLARRLNKDKNKLSASLNEINMCNWKYSPNTATGAVNFKIWDFPSQVWVLTIAICGVCFVLLYRSKATLLTIVSIPNKLYT